jgi:hypothetical protein
MLKPILVGFGLFMLGIMFLLISVTVLKYRTSWLFWTLIFYSFLLLFIIPIGTLFAFIGLITLGLNRKKFGSKGRVT